MWKSFLRRLAASLLDELAGVAKARIASTGKVPTDLQPIIDEAIDVSVKEVAGR